MAVVEKFKFLISRNNGIAVLSFSGVLAIDSEAEFTECMNQTFGDPNTKFLIVDFSKVGNVTMDLIPAFVQFQKTARNKNWEIRLCGIGDDLKEKLLKLGVIRYREISNNLKEGLSYAVQMSKHSDGARKAG